MLTRLTPLDGNAILPLADAKAQVRVLHNAEDDLIGALRDAALSHVERVSGVALAEAQFLWSMRCFPARVDLPMRPAIDLLEVVYLDSAGDEQDYDDARLIGNSVYPEAGGAWPDAYDSASVKFSAGLSSPADAPELIAAAKLLIGHLWENRSASSEQALKDIPFGVDALIQTYRQVLV